MTHAPNGRSRREFLHTTLWGGVGASLLGSRLLSGCDSATGGTGPLTAGADLPSGPALPNDPALPWWMNGNFGPVAGNYEAFDLQVSGTLPPELDGTYVRNGPNPEGTVTPHWFFGDGMLHGVRLSGGEAKWYRARYVDTLARDTRLSGGDASMSGNLSNTSVVHHEGRLYSLYEAGSPHLIDAQSLTTVEEHSFHGKLVSPMTAHPKIDPLTGEMVFFGIAFSAPFLRMYTANAAGEIVGKTPIDLGGSVMMHDFAITERYAVFMDMPVLFDMPKALSGEFPFYWAADTYGCRLGVIPRDGSADIRWFEIDPCYVFHLWNAWEDGDSIVMDVCRKDYVWRDGMDDNSPSVPYRWTIDLAAGRVSGDPLYPDLDIDFPRIDPRLVGREHRYGYALRLAQAEVFTTVGIDKLDLKTGDRQTWSFAEGEMGNEATFVPAEGGAEDEGWLLTYVFDDTRRVTDLCVLDATRVADGPIARVHLPRRVPHGFHGDWIPG